MRSRYTAYTLQDMPYLARTLHPSQRSDYDEAGAEKWARESEWDGLEIIEEALFLAATKEARGLPGYRGSGS